MKLETLILAARNAPSAEAMTNCLVALGFLFLGLAVVLYYTLVRNR